MNFIAPMAVRPRYHANDASRDVLALEAHKVPIEDARTVDEPPDLEREGFRLLEAPSAVADFFDPRQVSGIYLEEVRELVLALTGADAVSMTPGGVVRFSERSKKCGTLNNSRPARFVHVDVSASAARDFANNGAPRGAAPFVRSLQFNAWRVLTPPPQDLVPADAVFDSADRPEWSFEGLVIRHNPRQRWMYFADMRPDEVLLFRTNDSRGGALAPVAHSAFTVDDCPPGTPPRASIEVRGIAYWYG